MKDVIAFVGGSFRVLLSRHSSKANNHSLCLVFEYKDLTSNVARLVIYCVSLLYFKARHMNNDFENVML